MVRVRNHGITARVEIGRVELAGASESMRRKVLAVMAEAGYREVVIDERGYRPGGVRLPVVAS